MSPSSDRGIVRRVIDRCIDAIDWTGDMLTSTEVRDAIRRDLGLSPPDQIPLPADRLDSINRYRDTVSPDNQALIQAIEDILAILETIGSIIEAAREEGEEGVVDDVAYRFFNLMSLNYIRTRIPALYWVSQPLAFAGEAISTYSQGQREGDRVGNFFATPWRFFNRTLVTLLYPVLKGTSIHFLLDAIISKISGYDHAFENVMAEIERQFDTEEGVKQLSDHLFYPLAVSAIAQMILEEDSRIEVLQGWDSSPDADDPLAEQISERTISVVLYNQRGREGPLDGSSETQVGEGELQATFTLVPREHSGRAGIMITLGGTEAVQARFGPNWNLAFEQSSTSAISFFIGEGGLSVLGPSSGHGRLTLTRRRALASEDGVDAVSSGAGQNGTSAASQGTRLEFGPISITIDISDQDAGILWRAKDSALVLDMGSEDSFLRSIFPARATRLNFDLGIGASYRRKLYFEGGTELQTAIPISKSLGPLNIHSMFVGLETKREEADPALTFEASASCTVNLGPFKATVERLGFSWEVEAVDQDGRFQLPSFLGGQSVDFDIGFKPPNGIGLALDTGPVSGAGYLFYDAGQAQYAGIVQLQFEKFALTAIGLLTTRMPDGTGGFSLVIMLAVDDFPAIELGLGFKLTGIGGLLGVNRTVAVDVLQAGLKNKTLDRVLFPPDPVANAPAIISTLRSVFPPTPDQYVLGPIAQLSWGKEGLLTANVGIVLEFPSPLRLLLLGQMRAVFPTQDDPLVRLNLDVLGVIDFDKGEALVLATLYDSKLLAWSVSGDAAFFLRWQNQPTFILSVGGFHPDFSAPPELPALRRLTMLLSKGDAVQLRLTWYLALTSNTLQHGARVDLRITASKFRVDGHLSYDALFQFDPFYFVIVFSAAVTLKWGSHTLAAIQLDGSLSGPSPWHVQGKATFKIWRFSKSVKFDRTLGEAETVPPLPVVHAKPALLAALRDAGNWQAALPAASGMLVTFKSIPSPDRVMLHPLGTLSVRQQVVPLGVDIEKFGHAKTARTESYQITQVKLHGQVTSSDPLEEYFAPGEYSELTQSQQLSRPSFALMQAGMATSGSADLSYEETEVVHRRSTEISYETDLILADGELISLSDEEQTDEGLTAEQLVVQAAVGAAAQSRASRSGLNRFASQRVKQVEVHGLDYAVTTRDNVRIDFSVLGEPSPGAGEGVGVLGPSGGYTSYQQALQLIREYERRYPEEAKYLQVVPQYEARELAIQ